MNCHAVFNCVGHNHELSDNRLIKETVLKYVNEAEFKELFTIAALEKIETVTSSAIAATSSAIKASLDARNAVNDLTIQTIDFVNDAINNTAVEGGVLADTFVTVTSNLAGTVARTQSDKNNDTLHIKDFGGVGDGITDDGDAIRRAAQSGRKVIFDSKTYLLSTLDTAYTLQSRFFGFVNDTAFVGTGETTFVFDNPTKGTFAPYSAYTVGQRNITLSGIKYRGHKVAGTKPSSHRALGVSFYGCVNLSVTKCAFSTFERHSLSINRDSSVQDWIKNGEKNSVESVAALLATSSYNVNVSNNEFEHAGSNCMAFFGVHKGIVKNNIMDTTGGLYPNAFFTDDASSSTPLLNYAINHDIIVEGNTTNGVIQVDGCSLATVTKNIAREIGVRSYDFDQQKNNFGTSENEPFLWMNYLDRSISVFNNTTNSISVKAGDAVSFSDNKILSLTNPILMEVAGNGISWNTSTGVKSFFDTTLPLESNSGTVNIFNNTFTARTGSVVGIKYNQTSANFHWLGDGNIFQERGGSFSERVARGSSVVKKDESIYIKNSDRNRAIKEVNMDYDFKAGLSLQGIDLLTHITDISNRGIGAGTKFYKGTRGVSVGASGIATTLFSIEKLTTNPQEVEATLTVTGNDFLTGNSQTLLYSLKITLSTMTVVATKHSSSMGTSTLTFSLVESGDKTLVNVNIPAYGTGIIETTASSRVHKIYTPAL